ncbi:Pimeloyl-ACP methyl ester carboxylesterase [Sphingobium sp. AP50]|uniref:alpha/beta fold hydrolase n=1 Tax=Sphingobium sp. AP50 TaxID=1884369 RepID=UPI0008BCAC8C|nr:alpha/beta hydrolase [Sphingobium sp. AP50]SEJ81334.1 Pimeloyl-ACP methyl ester carboxylesterase [Sphingobium sp. AP50]
MKTTFTALALLYTIAASGIAYADAPNSPPDNSVVQELKGFTHHYAQANGIRLHYVSGGSGPTVLFIHGWPYSWYEWKDVLPKVAAAGYRTIAIDMPGYGDSQWPDRGYDKRSIAEDIHQLLGQLGVKEFYLVGTDIGTMVSYSYAAAYPQTVKKLVISESLIPGFGLEKSMDPDVQGFWHFGFHRQWEMASELIEGQEYYYLNTIAWTAGYGNAGVTDEDKKVYMRTFGAPGGMKASFGVYSTLYEDGKYNRDQLAKNGKLKMPVLVLNGDNGIPQRLLLPGVKDVAVNVTSGYIKDSGHAISENQPGEVAAAVLNFIKK